MQIRMLEDSACRHKLYTPPLSVPDRNGAPELHHRTEIEEVTKEFTKNLPRVYKPAYRSDTRNNHVTMQRKVYFREERPSAVQK